MPSVSPPCSGMMQTKTRHCADTFCGWQLRAVTLPRSEDTCTMDGREIVPCPPPPPCVAHSLGHARQR